MNPIRNRARFVAAVTLTWHVIALAIVSAALSCSTSSASEHAGMENCPLHASVPQCPVHAEKHGTHDCDCPTIGCSETGAEFLTLFGSIGILPTLNDIPLPLEAGAYAADGFPSAGILAPVPISPPPRS